MARAVHILFVLSLTVLGCLAGKPDFYFFPPSGPCRVVMVTADVLGVEMNMKLIDITKGEQMKPEYLKMNPQHTVPTLDDNGFHLSESRAIAAYLTSMSPKGEQLYPKDPKKRALVDQMLYFDASRLYQLFEDTYLQLAFGGAFDDKKAHKVEGALSMLEEFLKKNPWAAGDQMTLADISLLVTITTYEAAGVAMSHYPKITEWLAKTKAAIPHYQSTNQDGVDIWKGIFDKIHNTK